MPSRIVLPVVVLSLKVGHDGDRLAERRAGSLVATDRKKTKPAPAFAACLFQSHRGRGLCGSISKHCVAETDTGPGVVRARKIVLHSLTSILDSPPEEDHRNLGDSGCPCLPTHALLSTTDSPARCRTRRTTRWIRPGTW